MGSSSLLEPIVCVACIVHSPKIPLSLLLEAKTDPPVRCETSYNGHKRLIVISLQVHFGYLP